VSCPITHVVVQNTPPPNRVMTIAHLYPIPPKEEVVFQTVGVELEEDAAEVLEEDAAEAKVVRKRGRRPVRANEDAETK